MKMFYDHNGVKIINAHVVDALRDMESESVQCCITSPPYWGLRDYQLEPQAWDDPGDCKHSWLSTMKNENMGNGDGKSFRRDKKAWKKRDDIDCPEVCVECGAWN